VPRRRPAAGVLTGSVTEHGRPDEEGPLTLEVLQAAIRASWSLETCDPTDAARWTPANPSLGQCAVTALVVHDLLGGQLLEAEVRHDDGSRQGFHYWNRLAGVDIDLTREQFASSEHVQEPHLIDRLPSAPWRAHDQYVPFRDRVRAALGLPPLES
jgi:hypothetical protein